MASHSASLRTKLGIIAILLCTFSFLSTQVHAVSPLSGFNPATLTYDSSAVFVDGKTFLASDALPIMSFLGDDWNGAFNPDNLNKGIVFWKADGGMIYNRWRFALFHRGELALKTNKDSVEFLRLLSLKEELPVSKSFELNLSANGFLAKGVELSRGFSLGSVLKGLSAGITVRYLSGEKFQSATITGNAVTTGPDTYDFDFLLDYVYDDNIIYSRRDTPQAEGHGYSFDLGLRYAVSERLSAELLLRDIAGEIHWQNAPYTLARAISVVKSFDENGYQVYSPTISGFEGVRNFRQRIPLKTDITVTYDTGYVVLKPAINFIGGRPFYWMFLGYRINEAILMNAGYNTNYRAFMLGATYKKFQLNAYASDIDMNMANAVGLTLSMTHLW